MLTITIYDRASMNWKDFPFEGNIIESITIDNAGKYIQDIVKELGLNRREFFLKFKVE